MGKLVLVTRPENQAQRFAEEVRAAGGTPVLAPLLHIVPISIDFTLFPVPSLIVTTSPQALEGQDVPPAWMNIPVLCVGDHSAAHLRSLGFKSVRSVQGDSRDMIAALEELQTQSICYLRGEDIKTDLAAAAPQHRFTEIVTYRAEEALEFTPDIIRIFSHIHTITLFSARTAMCLARLIKTHDLGGLTPSINLLSLAPQMLEYCSDFSWKGRFFAPHPDQAHMMALLRNLLEDTP